MIKPKESDKGRSVLFSCAKNEKQRTGVLVDFTDAFAFVQFADWPAPQATLREALDFVPIEAPKKRKRK